MASGIRITTREMRYIALFENITGATVKDCIVDDVLNRIIFIIKKGDVGMAIGRKGKNIHVTTVRIKNSNFRGRRCRKNSAPP